MFPFSGIWGKIVLSVNQTGGGKNAFEYAFRIKFWEFASNCLEKKLFFITGSLVRNPGWQKGLIASCWVLSKRCKPTGAGEITNICFGQLSADQLTGHVTHSIFWQKLVYPSLSDALCLKCSNLDLPPNASLPVFMKGLLALKASAAQACSVRLCSVKPCCWDC